MKPSPSLSVAACSPNRFAHNHSKFILVTLIAAMRFVLSSKIHKATVTGAELSYIGSRAFDRFLVDTVGVGPGERFLIVSNASGARLETYTIPVEAGSGTICM